MEITFVRHAQKLDSSENPPLTKKGLKQAGKLAKKLSREKFDEFYCSDLDRVKQTAKIVSKKLKLEPKIVSALNEFDSEILKSGLRKSDKKKYDELKKFLSRFNPNEDKKVLIIAHGITNRVILSYLLEIDLKNLIRLRQSETGINKIYYSKNFNNWRLKIWNDTNHLEEKPFFSLF